MNSHNCSTFRAGPTIGPPGSIDAQDFFSSSFVCHQFVACYGRHFPISYCRMSMRMRSVSSGEHPSRDRGLLNDVRDQCTPSHAGQARSRAVAAADTGLTGGLRTDSGCMMGRSGAELWKKITVYIIFSKFYI